MSLIYVQAGKAVCNVLNNSKSPKAAVYEQFKGQGIKKEVPAILALTVATVKDFKLLSDFLIKTKLVSGRNEFKSFNSRAFQLLTMACDYRNGKKVRCSGALKKQLVPHLSMLEVKKSTAADGDDSSEALPRYLRVDFLRWTREEALEKLNSQFKGGFEADPIVPSVIVGPPRKHDAQLRCMDEVKDGRLVMQDRATCLSAYVAGIRGHGGIIIDVCAAPGSKSLSFLSMMRESGIVISIEKDSARFTTLVSRLYQESVLTHCYAVRLTTFKKSVVCVNDVASLVKSHMIYFEHPTRPNLKAVAICADFIQDICCCGNSDRDGSGTGGSGTDRGVICCDGNIKLSRIVEWLRSQVSMSTSSDWIISLDPSCSGSGLAEHDFKDESKRAAIAKRLDSLSKFQSELLCKALSISQCRTVLYSTCSIFYEENEKVVFDSLSLDSSLSHSLDSLSFNNEWKLVNDTPQWESSEIVAFTEQQIPPPINLFIRATPESHKCRGFFLAKMIRSQN